ncbi:MAG: hypothetical protein U0T74_01620 [Chitinophagales bacterium]
MQNNYGNLYWHRLKKEPLYIILLLFFIGRISLSGQGYLSDSDEKDFFSAINAFDDFINFEFRKLSLDIFANWGNPAEVLIKLFEVPFLKLFCFVTNKTVDSPQSLSVIGAFNIVVSIAILYVFYRILLNLKFDKTQSLTGVILLGSLVNMNLYVRHILSYDEALLFFLIALCLLTSSKTDLGKYRMAGIMAGIGFTTYPGPFMFLPILGLFILISNRKNFFRASIKPIIHFSFSILGVLLFFEAISRISGNSYIKSAFLLSDAIVEGSYNEGFSFLFSYVFYVEGVWGTILLACFFLSFLFLYIRASYFEAKIISLLAVFAYLSFAVYVYYFNQMVWYGRVLHMYFPFLVIGALVFLCECKWLNHKAAFILISLASAINYGYIVYDLNTIAYPRDVLYKYGIAPKYKNIHTNYVYQLINIYDYNEIANSLNTDIQKQVLADGTYDLLNVCWLRHYPDFRYINDYQPYNLDTLKSENILFNKTHFMSHPAYVFEYCTEAGKKFFVEKNFKIMIIKKS